MSKKRTGKAGLDPELYKEFRALAKRADQRAVRLEKYAKRPGYEAITGFAYRVFQSSLKAFANDKQLAAYNQGKPLRANVVPKSNRQMRAKMSIIRGFLAAQSSTLEGVRQKNPYTGEYEIKAGIKEIYMKRAQTFKDRYGLDVPWQKLGSIFESKAYQNLDSKYGSKTILRAFAQIKSNSDKSVIMALQAGKDVNVVSVGRDATESQIEQIIKEEKKKKGRNAAVLPVKGNLMAKIVQNMINDVPGMVEEVRKI